ncbi:MAG: hypothetical protein Q8942_06195 [Bacillota bacterium]|nr:hypothetical protein [Bacillota bacterium]
MNKETIVKVKKRVNPYTMIDSSIFLNNNISWKAKGLMGYFLSRPDDWKIHLKDLYRQSTDGYDSVKSGLKELKSHGYLELIPIREKGKIVAWEYIVYEVPIDKSTDNSGFEPEEGNPLEVKPLMDKPPDVRPREGNPLEVNPRYTNIDITNNDYTNNDVYKDFELDSVRFNKVLQLSNLNLFDEKISKAVEEALKGLFFDEEFAKRNFNLSLSTVRNDLEKINPLIIENAILKIKRVIASGATVISSKHYLMSCIYNCIEEYCSKDLVDAALTSPDIYKPHKTIFDLVKGAEFEEPVNLLSQNLSQLIFNAFFKDRVTEIFIDGKTLTMVINDVFVASTLACKYTQKVKECFAQLGVENVVFMSD